MSDRLSARLTLDAGGAAVGRQSHLPFGEEFGVSETQQKQHFTSYERDGETGTDYAVNRHYNQSTAGSIALTLWPSLWTLTSSGATTNVGIRQSYAQNTLVAGPDGSPIYRRPTDVTVFGSDGNQSVNNTETILQHCAKEVFDAIK